jgi:hypothetical protein
MRIEPWNCWRFYGADSIDTKSSTIGGKFKSRWEFKCTFHISPSISNPTLEKIILMILWPLVIYSREEDSLKMTFRVRLLS